MSYEKQFFSSYSTILEQLEPFYKNYSSISLILFFDLLMDNLHLLEGLIRIDTLYYFFSNKKFNH